MSLITDGNKGLFKLAKDKVPLPTVNNVFLKGGARHGMIKSLVALNTVMYGGYLFMTGPQGMQYKKFFTLDGNSSILSLPFCHFGHTDPVAFGLNSAALWTVGHYHAKKFGCAHLSTVFGLGCVLATALALKDVSGSHKQVIAGSTAGTTALITYNLFANPAWFKFARLPPLAWLGALAYYGGMYDDKAAVGGIAGGYIAFMLAL